MVRAVAFQIFRAHTAVLWSLPCPATGTSVYIEKYGVPAGAIAVWTGLWQSTPFSLRLLLHLKTAVEGDDLQLSAEILQTGHR